MDWADVIRLASHGNPEPPRRVEKTDAEWRTLLSADQYYVMRAKGTEAPHSSQMCSLFTPGRYSCACCNTELFDSATKFESGTGWPSFSEPAADNVVAYHTDGSLASRRVETICNVCDAHLGHVFPDGPHPSGLRFCINALSLNKIDDDAG